MSTEPISIHHFEIKKELLKDVNVLAAIDRGCSLLKVLFVTKVDYEASKQQDTMPFTVELFPTKHFESGIDSLLRQMQMPEDVSNSVLKVTGVGAEKEIELLREKTPFKVVFVQELYCIVQGSWALIKHSPIDDICYPKDEYSVEPGFVDSALFTRVLEQLHKDIHLYPEQDFPCLIAYLGSGGVFMALHEDGKAELIGGVQMSGKSFLGLAKLFINTSNYEEIMELADKGYRGNVDTQVREVLSNDPNSAYGQFKPDLPIFPFGKVVDYDKNLEDFSREDLASALIAGTVGNLIDKIEAFVCQTKCRRVFLGGNLLISPVFRRSFAEVLGTMGFARKYTPRIMKVGYATALGALLADPAKDNEW